MCVRTYVNSSVLRIHVCIFGHISARHLYPGGKTSPCTNRLVDRVYTWVDKVLLLPFCWLTSPLWPGKGMETVSPFVSRRCLPYTLGIISQQDAQGSGFPCIGCQRSGPTALPMMLLDLQVQLRVVGVSADKENSLVWHKLGGFHCAQTQRVAAVLLCHAQCIYGTAPQFQHKLERHFPKAASSYWTTRFGIFHVRSVLWAAAHAKPPYWIQDRRVCKAFAAAPPL